MRTVLVTGPGVVSPAGTGRDEFFANLLAGRSDIRRLASDFASKLSAVMSNSFVFGGSNAVLIARRA